MAHVRQFEFIIGQAHRLSSSLATIDMVKMVAKYAYNNNVNYVMDDLYVYVFEATNPNNNSSTRELYRKKAISYSKQVFSNMGTEMKKKSGASKTREALKANRVLVYPYNSYSRSARKLAQHFHNGKYLHSTLDGTFKPEKKMVLVNWGSGNVPYASNHSLFHVLNKQEKVNVARNKLKTFKTLLQGDVRVPEFTEDEDVALNWLNEGKEVLGRTETGTQGKDIIFGSESPTRMINECDFFVKYIKKKHEYRVHVFSDKVIDCQRKAIRKTDDAGNEIDTSTIDHRIRNMTNGFVFVRQDCDPPEDVKQQALAAIRACGLDFGAVDVIWNSSEKKAYVLEINTAPGLEGTTVETYTKAIENVRDNLS